MDVREVVEIPPNKPLDPPAEAAAGQRQRYLDSENRTAGTVVVYLLPGGHERLITFKVEVEQEADGRWLAEVVELPGVLVYGETEQAALSKVQALALRVIAERLEHGEAGPDLLSISFNAA